MIEVQHAALADHRIVIEILLQLFPKLHRPFVEDDIARQQIVRADDRRVAADIAAADPAFFQHRDIGEAVLFGEIIGGRKTVAAAANDDGVVFRLGFGIAPRRRPALMAGERVFQQGQERIMHGDRKGAAALRP